MGGGISVESEPGEGSTFSFTIDCPVCDEKDDTGTKGGILVRDGGRLTPGRSRFCWPKTIASTSC